MKLEDQVVSLELAQKLKELEVPQKSSFVWRKTTKKTTGEANIHLTPWGVSGWQNVNAPDARSYHYHFKDDCSAFTVAELGQILVEKGHSRMPAYSNQQNNSGWYRLMFSNKSSGHTILEDTEANARAAMLIYLIENNLLDPKTLSV